MNETMKKFLNELAELFDKYNITWMTSECNRQRFIAFCSNGKELHIGHYAQERFWDITTDAGDYSPKRCKNCLFECSEADEPCCNCDAFENYTEKPVNE